MNFQELNPPIIEISTHQTWYRIQRKAARKDSIRLKGYVLTPPGGLSSRFDLAGESTAYLGDTPETALYESLFRREIRSCSWERLKQRALVSFEIKSRLRLADLRGLPEHYPVLQSMRYEHTQSLAAECRQQDLHGILYASAQHLHHDCICLFESGMEQTRKTSSIPLVQAATGQLHKSVIAAAYRSQVPVIRE